MQVLLKKIGRGFGGPLREIITAPELNGGVEATKQGGTCERGEKKRFQGHRGETVIELNEGEKYRPGKNINFSFYDLVIEGRKRQRFFATTCVTDGFASKIKGPHFVWK